MFSTFLEHIMHCAVETGFGPTAWAFSEKINSPGWKSLSARKNLQGSWINICSIRMANTENQCSPLSATSEVPDGVFWSKNRPFWPFWKSLQIVTLKISGNFESASKIRPLRTKIQTTFRPGAKNFIVPYLLSFALLFLKWSEITFLQMQLSQVFLSEFGICLQRLFPIFLKILDKKDKF